MGYGNHWDEPARCHRCMQERSTHDDGYCAGLTRSLSLPAKSPQEPNTTTENGGPMERTKQPSEHSSHDIRSAYIQGLWDRLARHVRATIPQRRFIIGELTHLLSCTNTNE